MIRSQQSYTKGRLNVIDEMIASINKEMDKTKKMREYEKDVYKKCTILGVLSGYRKALEILNNKRNKTVSKSKEIND